MTEQSPAERVISYLESQMSGGLGPLATNPIAHACNSLRDLAATDDGLIVTPVHLASAIHRAVSGAEAPLPLLAAGAALFASLRILDDLMDGDENVLIPTGTAAELMVAGQLFALAAGRLVLDSTSEPRLQEAIDQRFRNMTANLAEGQLRDERRLDIALLPSEVEQTARLKSGSMLSAMAAIAAVVAGASESAIESAASLGESLALARQFSGDIDELFSDRDSDRRAGKCTIVLAFALHDRAEHDRPELIERIRAAAGDDSLHREIVADELMPAVRTTITKIDHHRSETRAALAGLQQRTASPLLDHLIDNAVPRAFRRPLGDDHQPASSSASDNTVIS